MKVPLTTSSSAIRMMALLSRSRSAGRRVPLCFAVAALIAGCGGGSSGSSEEAAKPEFPAGSLKERLSEQAGEDVGVIHGTSTGVIRERFEGSASLEELESAVRGLS